MITQCVYRFRKAISASGICFADEATVQFIAEHGVCEQTSRILISSQLPAGCTLNTDQNNLFQGMFIVLDW